MEIGIGKHHQSFLSYHRKHSVESTLGKEEPQKNVKLDGCRSNALLQADGSMSLAIWRFVEPVGVLHGLLFVMPASQSAPGHSLQWILYR
jgi:hypothetical protein